MSIRLKVNDRVTHRKKRDWVVGIVVEVEGDRITVEFPFEDPVKIKPVSLLSKEGDVRDREEWCQKLCRCPHCGAENVAPASHECDIRVSGLPDERPKPSDALDPRHVKWWEFHRPGKD